MYDSLTTKRLLELGGILTEEELRWLLKGRYIELVESLSKREQRILEEGSPIRSDGF